MKMIKETMAYKELRHSTGKEIEDLLGFAASSLIPGCENCAIRELCKSQNKYTCSQLWAKYLKGEINGEA
ncbi:MAG: hypothetical protein IKB61_00205 [Elusimicrobiaceae bacterium]|nr:hypothetical protein [Elusimicrobiaceae bacterium]